MKALASSFVFVKQLNDSDINLLETTLGPLDQLEASWYDVCDGVPCFQFISNMKHYAVTEKKQRIFLGYFKHSMLDCPVYQMLWFKYRGKHLTRVISFE